MKSEQSTLSPNGIAPNGCGPGDILRANWSRGAAWIVGGSIAIALLYFALVELVGRSLPVQALLYAAVPIACTLAARNTLLGKVAPRKRDLIVIAVALAWYMFFLAVAMLSTRI